MRTPSLGFEKNQALEIAAVAAPAAVTVNKKRLRLNSGITVLIVSRGWISE